MTKDVLNDSRKESKLEVVKGGKGKDNNETDFPKHSGNPPSHSDDELPKIKSLGVKEEFLIRYFLTGQIQIRMPHYIPKNPISILVHKPSIGSAQRILEINDEKMLVKEIDLDQLTNVLMKKIGLYFSNLKDDTYALSYAQVKNLTLRFIGQAKNQTEWPRPLGFAKSEGYFFERHNWDPIPKSDLDDFPIIKSFLIRTENFTSLCQIIGSLLKGKPIRKKSPLLWGEGGSGKSTFFGILKMLFGEVASKEVPETFGGNDKFASTFIKNTAAWFADDTTAKMINSTEFKKITGSDSYPMRQMRQDYVDVKIQGVFFLNANPYELKGIRNDKAIVEERLLSCEVEPMRKGDREDDREKIYELAKKELPYFAGYCVDIFKAKGHKIEPSSSNLVTDVVEEAENDLEAIFERYLEIHPSMKEKENEIFRLEWQQLWETICRQNASFAKEFKRKEWNAFVARKLDRDKPMVRCNLGKSSKRGVLGLKIKKQIQADLGTY